MVTAKINDDEELVTEIRAAIKENDGYCCCAIERCPEVTCPCANFRQMLKEGRVGETCHYGLYPIVEVHADK